MRRENEMPKLTPHADRGKSKEICYPKDNRGRKRGNSSEGNTNEKRLLTLIYLEVMTEKYPTDPSGVDLNHPGCTLSSHFIVKEDKP